MEWENSARKRGVQAMTHTEPDPSSRAQLPQFFIDSPPAATIGVLHASMCPSSPGHSMILVDKVQLTVQTEKIKDWLYPL